MKRLIIFLLCVSLVSCSNLNTENKDKAGVIGAVGLASAISGFFFYQRHKLNEKKNRPKVSEVIENIDTTGDMFHLGGVLVNPTQSLHVQHWPVRKNQTVRFNGKNGKVSNRVVVSKVNLGNDLSILTFDKPLDTDYHSVMPIGEALPDTPTTVQRFGERASRGYFVEDYEGVFLQLSTTLETFLESGDSGKKWIQIQDGKQVVVGLNSTQKGKGPNLYKIYNDYLSKQIKNDK